MSEGTTIEWTDATWNPLRAWAEGGAVQRGGWACVRVSQGCVNCYAATINKRLGTGLDYTVPALAKVRTYVDKKALEKPWGWAKPRRVFVCSMTDLFGEWVTDAEIREVFTMMAAADWHTYQVLTKRPRRMREWVTKHLPDGPLPNVWLGTSVESQIVDDRIAELVATPAAVRFLSCEPLIGRLWISPEQFMCLDWLIVGGESGPRARPMDLAWARSIVASCKAARVAVFVKQLGAKPVSHDASDWPDDGRESGDEPARLHDRKGGDMNEWPADLRVREWPVSGVVTTGNTQNSEHAE